MIFRKSPKQSRPLVMRERKLRVEVSTDWFLVVPARDNESVRRVHCIARDVEETRNSLGRDEVIFLCTDYPIQGSTDYYTCYYLFHNEVWSARPFTGNNDWTQDRKEGRDSTILPMIRQEANKLPQVVDGVHWRNKDPFTIALNDGQTLGDSLSVAQEPENTGEDAGEKQEQFHPVHASRDHVAAAQKKAAEADYLEGRLGILQEILGIYESIPRWCATKSEDFIDLRHGTALPAGHASIRKVEQAGRDLQTECEAVGEHLMAVNSGTEELRQDFDRMWARLLLAVDGLQAATAERDQFHDAARKPFISSLNQSDRYRLMTEALQRAAAALGGESYVPPVEESERRGTPRLSRKPIPRDVKIFVWQRDQGRCVECGSREKLEYDHIIPWADGGSDTARNLQLLCESCNRRKGKSL